MNHSTNAMTELECVQEELDYLEGMPAETFGPPKHVRVAASLPWMTAVRVGDTLWVSPELHAQARAAVEQRPG